MEGCRQGSFCTWQSCVLVREVQTACALPLTQNGGSCLRTKPFCSARNATACFEGCAASLVGGAVPEQDEVFSRLLEKTLCSSGVSWLLAGKNGHDLSPCAARQPHPKIEGLGPVSAFSLLFEFLSSVLFYLLISCCLLSLLPNPRVCNLSSSAD